jgi:hypothetical protein
MITYCNYGRSYVFRAAGRVGLKLKSRALYI